MRRIASVLVLQLLFAAGGAAQGSWTPTVDTMGAALGNAGRGAALGAVGGGVTRGVRQASSAEANFQQAFSNCLRARGHNVLN